MVSIDFDKTGARIDELRKENGFTVRQIQNIFGFSTPQTIYKWIHGASLPKIDNLVVLAEKVEEWKKATGRISPEEAKQYINGLKGRLNKIHDCSVDW